MSDKKIIVDYVACCVLPVAQNYDITERTYDQRLSCSGGHFPDVHYQRTLAQFPVSSNHSRLSTTLQVS